MERITLFHLERLKNRDIYFEILGIETKKDEYALLGFYYYTHGFTISFLFMNYHHMFY